ncbi:Pinoresinol reductase 2-like protein 1 [Colletotrichum plurivorum]|uniref:Pinoresinol reductase 2-like protein 1 n=1 Tax=Colletotrichum plurivorum TaxID=2175906 RepID=A0A8H6K3H2_9PEZI|nr:Pinoresinol reductase 2-like protein 1 [Colletotrichum plurivorum]
MSVAIAGGTGGLCRAMVEAIQARGTHEVIVLTRKVSGSPGGASGVRFIAVDYSSIDSLVSVFEDNNVETVISAVNNTAEDNSSELNLIRAAERQYEACPPVKAKKSALSALKSTSLEHTVVYNSYVLDYCGTPRLTSYRDDVACFVDVANNGAAIRDLESWLEETVIIRDKMTFHELVRLAEKVKGTNFTVVHDSVEVLEACELTDLRSHREGCKYNPKEMLDSFLASFGLACERGKASLNPSRTLNDELTEIKPIRVRKGMGEASGLRMKF